MNDSERAALVTRSTGKVFVVTQSTFGIPRVAGVYATREMADGAISFLTELGFVDQETYFGVEEVPYFPAPALASV